MSCCSLSISWNLDQCTHKCVKINCSFLKLRSLPHRELIFTLSIFFSCDFVSRFCLHVHNHVGRIMLTSRVTWAEWSLSSASYLFLYPKKVKFCCWAFFSSFHFSLSRLYHGFSESFVHASPSLHNIIIVQSREQRQLSSKFELFSRSSIRVCNSFNEIM